SLPNGDVNRFNRLPLHTLVTTAPLLRRNQAGDFTRKINARLSAESGHLRELRNAIDTQKLAQIIEVNIAGVNDGFVHSHAAMSVLIPTKERSSIDHFRTPAIHMIQRRNGIPFQSRSGFEDFKNGSRGLHALYRAVMERIIRIIPQG